MNALDLIEAEMNFSSLFSPPPEDVLLPHLAWS